MTFGTILLLIGAIVLLVGAGMVGFVVLCRNAERWSPVAENGLVVMLVGLFLLMIASLAMLCRLAAYGLQAL